MEYKLLNNGVKMPVLGYGVYQVDPPNARGALPTPSPRATARLTLRRLTQTNRAWATPLKRAA